MDVLEIDGASNRGIDEVRELRESAKYQPIRDRFRIFIIDEVHMLTMEAFNALLKILEEPPPHVFFIFATTEARKVPATIVSRCQQFEFKRIPDRILVQRLSQIVKEEKIKISEKSLEMIASASEGGLRDALGTLDQIIAFSGAKIEEKDVEAVLGLVDIDVMFELARAIAKGQSGEVISILDRIAEYGIDYKVFYNELLNFYRDLFLARISDNGTTRKEVDPRMKEVAMEYDEIQLMRICHQLVSMQNSLKLAGNLRFLFEITLAKLSKIKSMVPIEEALENIKKNVSWSPAKVEAPSPTVPAFTAPTTKSVDPSTVSLTITDDFLAELISDLEQVNAKLAAALENAAFVRNAEKMTFYVPETSFGMMSFDSKAEQDLQGLLQRKLGVAMTVQFQRGAPPVEKPAQKVATPETLVQSDPLVQEFMKTFQGKISKIELNKR